MLINPPHGKKQYIASVLWYHLLADMVIGEIHDFTDSFYPIMSD